MRHIYSKEFRYVPSAATDIRKTFARVKREQAEIAKEVATKVKPIIRVKRTA